jgi:hypothetical protein
MDLAARLGISFEALLFAYGVVVSATLFLVARRRLSAKAGAVATIIAAALIALGQFVMMDPTSPGHQVVRASFIVIPAIGMFAAARTRWVARRSWLLLLAGPIAFVVSYACVCVAMSYGIHAVQRFV